MPYAPAGASRDLPAHDELALRRVPRERIGGIGQKDRGDIYPNLILAENVLETGLSNINAIMHPAGMLGNAGWIEKSGGDFYYYREGITPSIAAWIEGVDGERLEIVKRLGLKPLRFVDIFYQAGLTSEEARASGSIYRAIHESEPELYNQIAGEPRPSLYQGRRWLRPGPHGGNRHTIGHRNPRDRRLDQARLGHQPRRLPQRRFNPGEDGAGEHGVKTFADGFTTASAIPRRGAGGPVIRRITRHEHEETKLFFKSEENVCALDFALTDFIPFRR